MKKGNVYRHYKGGIYTYMGIAVPQTENHDQADITGYTLIAKHTETEKIVNITRALFTRACISDLDHPTVLYKDTKDGQLWVRPVDEFFGWVLEDGYPTIQRFKLVESK
jgi:hypothetical protein